MSYWRTNWPKCEVCGTYLTDDQLHTPVGLTHRTCAWDLESALRVIETEKCAKYDVNRVLQRIETIMQSQNLVLISLLAECYAIIMESKQ